MYRARVCRWEKISSNLEPELWLDIPGTVAFMVYGWFNTLTFAYACIAAGEAVPLLPVSVQPDAEDHEDDPAGGSYPRYEGRLLDHIWDLLGQGVLLAHSLGHSPRCIWGWGHDWRSAGLGKDKGGANTHEMKAARNMTTVEKRGKKKCYLAKPEIGKKINGTINGVSTVHK